MTSSCSFRITRTAEDMAHTINVLSQRVIDLEQRQASLELKLSEKNIDPPSEEIKILDDVDQLLRDCQELLASSSTNQTVNDTAWHQEVDSGTFAA